MKREMNFDFKTFFLVLYAALYPHSTEAKEFKKGAASKRVKEYAQEITEIKNSRDQEIFQIQAIHFIGEDQIESELNLFLLNDFLKSYDLLPELVAATDELLQFTEKLAI